MTSMVPLGQMAPLPAPAGSGVAVSLPRRAKAAIVVRLLLNEGADIPLEDLPEDLQALLTHQMGAMRVVDKDTLAAVIDEFAQEVSRIGLSFPGGIAGALTALDGKISRQTAERLRKEAGVRQAGDPWKRLAEMDVESLVPLLHTESTEVAAVMLSKLPVSLSAALLGRLPGAEARRITYAVSLTSGVTPDAVDRIGLSLAAQLDATPITAFDQGPVERVGAILNSSTTLTRDDVLDGLDEKDKGFASAVRKAIFTFGNIPNRIAPRDIPKVMREVNQDNLVLALAGAAANDMEKSAEFILENMSGRMADQLREAVEEAGEVKPADVEDAMSDVVNTIRKMEANGELLLIVEEDEEEAG